MPIPPLPFLNFLSGAVALDNVPALFDDKSDAWLRYGELRERIKTLLPYWRTPTHIQKRGVILAALPRTINGVLAYLSAAASGQALILVDPSTARPDLFIQDYEPDWIVLATAMKPGENYLPVDWPIPDLFLWRRVVFSNHDLNPDLFLLLLPPGPPDSTKTVRLSYQNLTHNILASLEPLELDPSTRALLLMPLSYSFGLSILHMMLTIGGSVILTENDVKSRVTWNMAQKREATLFAGVPFHFEYLARAGIDNLHVPRLKIFLQAGGRMPLERTQEIMKQVAARAGAFFVLYGLTEASPRIACLPVHLFPEKIQSLGRLIKDATIRSESDRSIYRGPNVMMGYATTRADLALDDTQRGELVLPEQGKIDADGFLDVEC
ncbi:MAG: AMP-binding protein [Alphaproteobacteria bacterium]|nr:AMP-binding protein [Alphaproteobacteria bacterium]